MDGKIVIGTEIDNKEFNKQLNDLQKQANKSETTINVQTDAKNLKEQDKALQEINQRIEEGKLKINGLASEIDKYDFEGKFKDLGLDELNKKIKEVKPELEELEDKIVKTIYANDITPLGTIKYEGTDEEIAKLKELRGIYYELEKEVFQRTYVPGNQQIDAQKEIVEEKSLEEKIQEKINQDLKDQIEEYENIQSYIQNIKELSQDENLKMSLEEKDLSLGKSFEDIKNTKKELMEVNVELANIIAKRRALEQEIEQYKRKMESYQQSISQGTGSSDDRALMEVAKNRIERAQLAQSELNEKFEEANRKVEELNNKLAKNEFQYKKNKNKIEEIIGKTREVSDITNTIKLGNIETQLGRIGNSMNGIAKKVVRWGLAIFGIRSAYMAVRQAMSTLSQYDDQMAKNVEWIRYLLASTLKPLIEYIINLIYKLLAYINFIAQGWFGINLFANASVEAFSKANKNVGGISSGLGKATKEAKELNKQLAGFDEMNILQDNKDSGSAGGSGGGAGGGAGGILPNFPKMEDIEKPEWLQWIIDNKDLIIAALAGIAAGLLALKLGLDPLKSLGIGIAVAYIVKLIQDIIKYIKDPSFDNFIDILIDIAAAVMGIAIAFGAWPVAAATALVLIVLTIVKYFDEIMGLFNKLIAWLDKNVLSWLKEKFGVLGEAMYIPIKYFVEFAKGAFESFYGGIKRVIDGVMKIFKGDFWGGIKTIFGGLLSVMTAPLQGFLKAVKSIIPNIVSVFSQIGTKIGDVIGKAFKTVINGVLGFVEKFLNTPIRAVNDLIGVINVLPGVKLSKLKTFKLPRLAKGGIINLPGRGVPVGGAIAGEAGREAVLPLQDEQVLNEIAEAIGRKITINANITNTMNGRVISRELKTIQNNDDFAFNR